MLRKLLSLLACFTIIAHADIVIDLSGTITNSAGVSLENALVTLENVSQTAESNSAGNYLIRQTVAVRTIATVKGSNFSIKNSILTIVSDKNKKIKLEAFNLNGKKLWSSEKMIPKGTESIKLQKMQSSNVSLFRLSIDNQTFIIKSTGKNGQYQITNNNVTGTLLSEKNALISATTDTLRVSKAGYLTKRVPVSSLVGTINVALDTLINNGTGTNSVDDGSFDRLTRYGEAQYFWGTLGGVDQPLVKIVHAVSADAVDIEVIFSPWFVDNTYGVNAIGWGKRGHTFKDLYHSDHVALAINNGAGDTVFAGKLDLISATTSVASGYACLGPFGGEGIITKGNASDIISFGNSMDDNLNYYGYNLQVDSPATDTFFTPNSQYPFWQYYVVYRLTMKSSAFGSSGYGKVTMTSVHASPSKDEQSTITVIEKGVPTPNSDLDVFRFRITLPIVPPVIDTIDVD